METAILVIQTLMIAFFAIAGALKLIGHPHMKEEFDSFGYPYWLARLAAVIELIAVPALIVGIWLPHYAALGAWLLTPVMLGATYTNFTKRPAAFGWGTLVIVGICVLVGMYYWGDLETYIAGF